MIAEGGVAALVKVANSSQDDILVRDAGGALLRMASSCTSSAVAGREALAALRAAGAADALIKILSSGIVNDYFCYSTTASSGADHVVESSF